MVRAKENYEQAEFFAQKLCRRRDQTSLATNPQTEEWVMKAILFLLFQPRDYPAHFLRFCLRPSHKIFGELSRNCTDQEITDEFQKIGDGTIRSSQYAAAKRLIDTPCSAPAFIVRC